MADFNLQTVYFDHQILVSERQWPLLNSIFGQSDSRRVVVSQYNLLEIGNAGDMCQARRRITLLDSLSPLWMRERIDIQRQEVRGFIWKSYFGVEPEPVFAFSANLSVVLAYYLRGRTPIISSAKEWLNLFGGRVQLDQPKQATVNALGVLQNVGRQRKAATEPQAFGEWVFRHVPCRDPENRLIDRAQRLQIADHCLVNRPKLLEVCPSMAVEDTMADIRTSDPRRSPKVQDALDLQHTVSALSYCHAFITADRYLYHCAKRTAERMPSVRMAKLYRNLYDFAGDTGSY